MKRGPLSEEEKIEIVERYQSGEKPTPISIALDRSYSTVWTHLNVLGFIGNPPAARSTEYLDLADEQERIARRSALAETVRLEKEARAAERERNTRAALLPGQVSKVASITPMNNVRSRLWAIIKAGNSKSVRKLTDDLIMNSSSLEKEDIEVVIDALRLEIKELNILKRVLTDIKEGRQSD